MIIVKTPHCQKQRHKFTLSEFKKLICEAQAHNKMAIDMLCAAFAPLIYKESSQSNIRASLGEDAVNMAWVIFLDFIKKYNGRDYRHLPGLIQCHLRYELLHKITRYNSIKNYTSLDLTDSDGNFLQIPDKHNAIEQLENNQMLAHALNSLTKRQREIILAVHFQGYTLQEYSKLQKISYKTFYLHYQRALAKLKKLLS